MGFPTAPYRTLTTLPASGALDDALASVRVREQGKAIAVSLWYKSASPTGYPGFRVYVKLAGLDEEHVATVRDGTLSTSGKDAVLSEYQAVFHCKDLTGADGTDGVYSYRTITTDQEVYAFRLAPFEAGDDANPGDLQIRIGGVQ